MTTINCLFCRNCKNDVFYPQICKHALYESSEWFCHAPRQPANPCLAEIGWQWQYYRLVAIIIISRMEGTSCSLLSSKWTGGHLLADFELFYYSFTLFELLYYFAHTILFEILYYFAYTSDLAFSHCFNFATLLEDMCCRMDWWSSRFLEVSYSFKFHSLRPLKLTCLHIRFGFEHPIDSFRPDH